MKVAINCRSFLNKQYTGIGRYTYHLIDTLGKIDTHNRYLLYAKKSFTNFNKRIPKFSAKNLLLMVDRFDYGMEKVLGKTDIYHSPSPDSLTMNGGVKSVVTVHDLIFKTFPQGHTQNALDETERKFQSVSERASRIICCSKNTIQDLQKYFNVPDEKISLVYQGVDKNTFYPIFGEERKAANRMLKLKGIRDPYILSVGTIEPRKNLPNILHAFEKLRARKKFKGKLVVIGMKGWMSEGIEELIRKLQLKNHVCFMGYLKDHELRYFYNQAKAFLFPSFYEGFGFPIVESFCCGTPVITSNVSSCPEVAQDAAIMVNPYHPEEIADGVARVINDLKLHESLRQKGLERGGDFDFFKTAHETLKVYKQVYNS